jgi:hypothetical protein
MGLLAKLKSTPSDGSGVLFVWDGVWYYTR